MFETFSIKGRKLSRTALVLLYFVIWLVQETRATFRSVENKTNHVTRVFLRFTKLLGFTLSSHRLVRFSMLWLVVVIASVLILRLSVEKRFVMWRQLNELTWLEPFADFFDYSTFCTIDMTTVGVIVSARDNSWLCFTCVIFLECLHENFPNIYLFLQDLCTWFIIDLL